MWQCVNKSDRDFNSDTTAERTAHNDFPSYCCFQRHRGNVVFWSEV